MFGMRCTKEIKETSCMTLATTVLSVLGCSIMEVPMHAPSKALNYIQVVAGKRLPAGFQQHPPYG